jgi:hypothetical protein
MGVDLEHGLDLERDLVQILDLAGALVDMLIKKETPAVRVSHAVVGGDEGIDHNEGVALRQILEPCLVDHVDFSLLTAVQDHHHRYRDSPGVGGRDEDLILAIARAEVGFGGEQFLLELPGGSRSGV